LSLICILASCEYSYNYTYSIKNNADSTISVHLKTYKSDSVYSIQSDSTETVYFTDHGIEGSRGPYFKDVSNDLQFISVMKGNTGSGRDYKTNSSWLFIKTNGSGVYTATVNNNEF
jgi:hypothetical protein